MTAAATPAPAPPIAAALPPPRIEPSTASLSDAEQRRLAAIPLPRLPTLQQRDAVVAEAEAPRASVASAAANARLPATEPEAGGATPGRDADATSSSSVPADIVRAELALASDRSGLDEPQLERIRSAQALFDRGDAQAALTRLEALNRELDAAAVQYTVGRGENLWQIAAKAETYGNAYLWPLVWHANEAKLDQPWKLKRGQVLKIPRYPRLSEVSNALQYAHEHSPDGRPPADAPAP